MLRKVFLLLILVIVVNFSTSFAADSNKVAISETTSCADQALQLNGFGTRKKLFIKLYIAALYVQEKVADADKFLKMEKASCMRLHITSSKITSEKMINATREGFEKSTKGNTAPIENEIETFLAWLEQPIKKGDVLEFTFVPHNATHVFKNGSELGVIESKAFSSALFGIWVGEMPAQQDLKNKLLGR